MYKDSQLFTRRETWNRSTQASTRAAMAHISSSPCGWFLQSQSCGSTDSLLCQVSVTMNRLAALQGIKTTLRPQLSCVREQQGHQSDHGPDWFSYLHSAWSNRWWTYVLAVCCGALNVRACSDAFSHRFCEDTNARRIIDQIYTLASVEHRDTVEDVGDSRHGTSQQLLDNHVVLITAS